MKYAICNELFGELAWAEAFDLARHFGYTGLEVAPFTLGDPDAIEQATRQRFVHTAQAAGLEVIGLHWLLAKTEGFHLTIDDEAIRQRTAEYLTKLAQLCRDLGGHLMVLGSPQQRNFGPHMSLDQAIDNAAWVLERVVPTLERLNVQIAVEPLGPQEGNFLNLASDASRLIDKVASSYVQLHLDVKAMSTEPTPIPQIIREQARQMIHFHANDPNRLGPGMGSVDFRPIFQALREVDYQGWVSVEVFDYSPGVETILRESMRNMLAAQNA